MILPITLTAAGVAALINIWLAIRCGQVRTKEKISVGDGGSEALIRRMRAHANFVEFTPFVLILIAVVEMASGTSTWLWIVAGLYMAARIAHGIGMDGVGKWREIGIIVTMLVLVGLGGYAIALPHLSAGAISAPGADDAANDPSTEEVPEG
ncbi:MAG: MAPEG family protein [Sphingomonadaceae bacterium]